MANAAHQLRTPLAGLKTQAELALRQTSLPESQKALKEMHSSIERSSRLVTQLLAMARAEPKAVASSQFQVLNLVDIARNVTSEFVNESLKKEIDLGFDCEQMAAVINGDYQSIRDLIANLVENALCYTPAGGVVTVRVRDESQIKLIVEDTGCGIPVEERQRVFERFYRLGGNNVTGSGLGLAIVKEVAENHGAQISLDSGPSNIGLIVTICFPKADDQEAKKL